jgi:hypothetical protein
MLVQFLLLPVLNAHPAACCHASLPPCLQLRAGEPRSDSPKSVTLAQRRRGEFPPTRDIPTPDVRLYHRAVVVAQDVQGQLRGLVRQLSIDQFENESRRVSMGAGASEATSVRNKTPLFERSFSEPVSGWIRSRQLAGAALAVPLPHTLLLSTAAIHAICSGQQCHALSYSILAVALLPHALQTCCPLPCPRCTLPHCRASTRLCCVSS